MNDKPHFIFIDPRSTVVKQFKISVTKFVLVIFVLFLLIGVSLKLAIDLGVKFNHNSQITQLQAENGTLQQQLKIMGDKILTIRNHIDQIEILDDQIRSRL